MAAPHQNIADIVVLKTTVSEPDHGDLNLDTDAPVGLKLAARRKANGLTYEDVHAGTKIKIVHIAAIEAGDKGALPATPFTAGFVKAYAQFLGLDADAYARAYKQEAGFQPLAAPVKAAIVREVMQAHEQSNAPDDKRDPEPVANTAPIEPTLTPTETAPEPNVAAEAAPAAKRADPDRMVTWLGAGAAVAVAAFLAGRAAAPERTAPEIAPAPTVVAAVAAPAPSAIASDQSPSVVEPPPPSMIEIIETPPALATVKPPAVKPRPRKPIVQEAPPALVEETPAPVLVAAAVIETPAEPAPEPQPTIVPARLTLGVSPDYPERCALRAGATVGVSVIFSITAEGKPVSATVASSEDRCFNSAALRTVYDMRFSPRTIDGVPSIETAKTVTVKFVR